MGTFHAKVVGVLVSNANGISRQAYIAKFCRIGMPVVLHREPANPYDANAVAVFITARVLIFFSASVQIGYLPADLAPEIARHLDQGGKVTAVVSKITGGSESKRSLGVNLRITKF
ncbi:HIRAN domain-containing protein [Xanthomonas floridensis]|uniref:HIRAN domain-containing protein n=1 Tax=Xanthomonas floridensis TaxID=1843580 RepID=A0ABU5Q2X4_9XANT|nr:HIRAN domain-containing protein [Xanthomonas floridensis]MEA5126243.1 HIRAN domain-containing protein [Xanthomonas floridensis]MEA5134181.1 HIRAN domain-containing protein [Xanthomonas floridensis]